MKDVSDIIVQMSRLFLKLVKHKSTGYIFLNVILYNKHVVRGR